MAFTQPIYLLLLAPLWVWTYFCARQLWRRKISGRASWIALRCSILLLLVLALSGLQTEHIDKGVATVFVLDQSASMTDTESADAKRFIGHALQAEVSNDQAGLIVFGGTPMIDTETGQLHALDKIYTAPPRSSTDIAAAIRLACASMPEGLARRIVLLSDGNETSGDAVDAAQAAGADGVEIDTASLFSHLSPVPEALVESVTAPNEATKGQPFELKVVVQSTGPASGTLNIDRDGQPTAQTHVDLTRGENVIAVDQTAGEPGFNRYRATLTVDNDTDSRNNVGITFVAVRGRPRILLVEGHKDAALDLQNALASHNIDAVRVNGGGVPTSPEELQSYDALALCDYPENGLTDEQMRMIASAVRESGIGFAMIGGDNSFLPGGYYETPIADILPVDLNVKQRKSYPSTCIEIVVDASGSMSMPEGGVEKVKIAGTAAAAMVRMMTPNDLVGVAGSTDDIRFVVPIQPAVDKDRLAAECGTLEAGGGGIYIEPSLEFADRTLSPIKTQVRHLILMSDGDDAEQQEGSLQLARQMVAKGMTISVVAIGDGKDVGFLRSLAAVGKGYYYLADQAKKLQGIVTQDTSIESRSAIEVGAFIPRVDPGDEVLQGLDLRSMPPLYAYDLTADRPLSRIPMRTSQDDPLLAYWQYGLGTSMAFTSDAEPKWARQWMGWSDFNSFWAQAVRETMRQQSTDNITMSSSLNGSAGDLEVAAYDRSGAAINGLAAKVNVVDPDGTSQQVPIEQTGPGKYSGKFDAEQIGSYIITAAQQGSPESRPTLSRAGFAVAYPPEYASTGPNLSLLSRIASAAGGASLADPLAAFQPVAHPGKSVHDLWQALLLASVLLFVADIAVRRLSINPTEVGAKFQALSRTYGSQVLPPGNAVRLIKGQRAASLPLSGRVAAVDQANAVPPKEIAANAVDSADQGVLSKPDSPALNTAQRLLELKRKGQKK